MPEPPETEDVDIQDAAALIQKYQILLGLHGKLIRHDHKKILPWIFFCTAGDFFIKSPAFARAGRTEIELKAHDFLPYLFTNFYLQIFAYRHSYSILYVS